MREDWFAAEGGALTDRDKSNGYEGVAALYVAERGQNADGVGTSVVAEWSKQLPAGASVLDVGCGPGVPVSKVLIDRGFDLYGVDASPAMVAAFRKNFPGVPVVCSAIEDSDYFDRQFDAVVAWGVMFLLDEQAQRTLIRKACGVLRGGGRFLFTSPSQICSWQDAMTDRLSISLGRDEYRKALDAEGLSVAATFTDEGDNFYYSAQKR